MKPRRSSQKKQDRQKTYVQDFQIDTDLEIMFPDEYISNISERIRLYKELNEIASDEELAEFQTETDRQVW